MLFCSIIRMRWFSAVKLFRGFHEMCGLFSLLRFDYLNVSVYLKRIFKHPRVFVGVLFLHSSFY